MLDELDMWCGLTDGQIDAFKQELFAEIPDGHPLDGIECTARATRVDSDDVLFEAADGKFFVVHLTWKGKTEKTGFPGVFWAPEEDAKRVIEVCQ